MWSISYAMKLFRSSRLPIRAHSGHMLKMSFHEWVFASANVLLWMIPLLLSSPSHSARNGCAVLKGVSSNEVLATNRIHSHCEHMHRSAKEIKYPVLLSPSVNLKLKFEPNNCAIKGSKLCTQCTTPRTLDQFQSEGVPVTTYSNVTHDTRARVRICEVSMYSLLSSHPAFLKVKLPHQRRKLFRKLMGLIYLESIKNHMSPPEYQCRRTRLLTGRYRYIQSLPLSFTGERLVAVFTGLSFEERIPSFRSSSDARFRLIGREDVGTSPFHPPPQAYWNHNVFQNHTVHGGGVARIASSDKLAGKGVEFDGCLPIDNDHRYRFLRYYPSVAVFSVCNETESVALARLSLYEASEWLSIKDLIAIAKSHGMLKMSPRTSRDELMELLSCHSCSSCLIHVCAFEKIPVVDPMAKDRARSAQNDYARRMRKIREENRTTNSADLNNRTGENQHVTSEDNFPPPPPSKTLMEKIINDFCLGSSRSALEEVGCAVCGTLCPANGAIALSAVSDKLHLLLGDGVTRAERTCHDSPMKEISGPVLDSRCEHVCHTCHNSLTSDRVPKHALKNHLWIGEVPPQLRDLSFAERLMVARIRHNRCLVRVASGRAKMTANVIMYSNPTLKVYHSLPPSREELDQVLAFIFTGASQPTEEDFKKCPMLVRRSKVLGALEWLKMNHRDYSDLEISMENLASYPLVGVPVTVDFRRISDESVTPPSATSVHHNDEDEGAVDGPCPFTVHGLSGEEYGTLSIQALKARALRHLEAEGKILAIGHSETPQSMYDNPQAYPQMFPWLFPYGLGGIGQEVHSKFISDAEHKKHLLMYHDKRFQLDLYFPIVAFNHEQVKGATKGSFLLSNRNSFPEVAAKLAGIDKEVLKSVTTRMINGEHVKPSSPQEQACFDIIDQLDHIGGHVKGSITSKKYMRNEIWSMLSFKGAPSWFITLSPADNRHPISIYYADNDLTFKPQIRSSSDRNRLTSGNPVAASRFFHVMVELFIAHVLGVSPNSRNRGLYGRTSGYYGTVEQQGRLTLHLHTLVWISGSLSPQEIRDRIMNKDSNFQKALVDYLEGVHQGEFLTGTMQEVRDRVPSDVHEDRGMHAILREPDAKGKLDYVDPTLVLPKPPPPLCSDACRSEDCGACKPNSEWWVSYMETVDDLVLRSNVHRCSASKAVEDNASEPSQDKERRTKPKNNAPKGCMDSQGNCRARFPRKVYPGTSIDHEDGHIFLKKLESMINTFSPVLTYLFRCNTDVTSLLSGTSIKAIVSYISDYISKPSLKSYQIFSSMYDVFDRRDKAEDAVKSEESGDPGRRILLSIVNSLSSKMEIGSPMASMYLLGNPDHYTDHEFVTFWWKSYVSEVLRYWKNMGDAPTLRPNVEDLGSSDSNILKDTIVLGRHEGRYVGCSIVDDYKYRPEAYENIALYEWIQTYQKRKRTKKEIEAFVRSRQTDAISLSQLSANEMTGGGAPSFKHREESRGDTDKRTGYRSIKYLSFQRDHPLYLTHVVRCLPECAKNTVPNFVGGSLPRMDQGDREYYCCTMLALFKPWRCGGDLKTESQSWDESFSSYSFSSCHQRRMRNFNLRYECLDARDDFHAELKAKQSGKNSEYGEYDGDNGDLCDSPFDDFVGNAEQSIEGYEEPGRAYLYELECKRKVDVVMRNAGWLSRAVNVARHSYSRIVPSMERTSSAWAALVKAERAKIFKNKLSGYTPPNPSISGPVPLAMEDVKVVSSDYLLRSFKPDDANHAAATEDIVRHFTLNDEQERAYRIIANHASSLAPEQLKMYMGGIGGTGKSQVIKSVMRMFEVRGQSHRFIVLGPTGTSAALLNGSTYHSVLGIYSRSDKGSDHSKNEGTIINEVRNRLQGVQYIFIDEVSMVSCRDLYNISRRLSQVLNNDAVFGGMNIILAGDFAQLPPVGSLPLYSNRVSCTRDASMKPVEQEAALGKIFWHQFTTVVILKQNMRQRTQTEDDASLRTALANMRYASCTPEDVQFLNSRVARFCTADGAPILTHPDFRNVSVITAWNNQKDRFNEQGSARFSEDNAQSLQHFYSTDVLSSREEGRPIKKGRSRNTTSRKPSKITEKLQRALWACGPCSSEQVASKLSLCIGMPVMIRNNDATELCITKGQEAVVVGWSSSVGSFDMPVLDTLFVELTNPPQVVKLPDLPTNVVPIPKSSTRVTCTLKNGSKISVLRHQVSVLPNFAMTDYSSQGKTRPYNVVHLEHCKDHTAYYTCLSRSSSAAGTVLLEEVDPAKICKGISGHLRQEFRELNVLDEVTRLRYEGLLPDGILKPLRNPTVRAYHALDKNKKCDGLWDQALQYAPNENRARDFQNDDTWVHKSQSHAMLSKGRKRAHHDGRSADDPDREVHQFRRQLEAPSVSPIGLIWDASNHSCAYDSFFTVLYNTWEKERTTWTRRLSDVSESMSLLCRGFQQFAEGLISLEDARDTVRDALRENDPDAFPTGATNTYISNVVTKLMGTRTCGTCNISCSVCGYSEPVPLLHYGELVSLSVPISHREEPFQVLSLAEELGWQRDNRQRRSGRECIACLEAGASNRLVASPSFERMPYIVVVELNAPIFCIDPVLQCVVDGFDYSFSLTGVVYGGQEHFVCRFVDANGDVWFHDGITTGSRCVKEFNLRTSTDPSNILRTTTIDGFEKQAIYAVYTRE